MASDDTGINEEEDEDEAFLLCETGNQLEAEKAKKEPMELVDDFGEVRYFFNMVVKQWQDAYAPGTYLVADESMVFWVGTGSAHLTYIPRKPTPLGIMLKTVVDQQTGILVNAEIVEAAETMREREYVKEWGQTTATTLRLCEPF